MQRAGSRLVAVWIVGALQLVRGFGSGYGIFEIGPLEALAASWAVPYLVSSWARADSRSTGYWPAFHHGAWLLFAWPIAVPHYVLRTRGRVGLPLAVGLLLAIVSGAVGWALAVAIGLATGRYTTR